MGLPWPSFLWKKYKVVASPSQMVDYAACPLRRWFKKVGRLPELAEQGRFVLGNALHGVVERFLRGDEELYPSGWDHGLSPFQAQLLIDRVADAISAGVLRPLKVLGIEVASHLEISSAAALIGKMDVVTSDGVEDHKTTSSRRWIATEEDLLGDTKMLCYARMWQLHSGKGTGADVRLRLNYFSKSPRDKFVDSVEATVTADDVEQHWNKVVVPTATLMVRDMKRGKGEVERAADQGPCAAYGGCPFLDICNGMESVPQYRERVNRTNDERRTT